MRNSRPLSVRRQNELSVREIADARNTSVQRFSASETISATNEFVDSSETEAYSCSSNSSKSDSNDSFAYHYSSCSDCESDEDEGHEFETLEQSTELSIKESIMDWFFKFQISLVALGFLLKILVKYGIKDLPLDPRTLLKTPKQISSRKVGRGWYHHFGLELVRIFSNTSKPIPSTLPLSCKFLL